MSQFNLYLYSAIFQHKICINSVLYYTFQENEKYEKINFDLSKALAGMTH
jgi:hypothetical protein